MRKFSFFALVISFTSFSGFSYYLPIGMYDKGKLLCYHITDTDVELITVENVQSIFKPNSALFFSAIPFSNFPIQPVLFFDKTGFSYFDQGILKSKYFAFRSPGSIYTFIPFDHTMGIHWYCKSRGIISILKNNFYVIYDLSRENGEMTLIIDDSLLKTHSLFPFLLRDSIFYISESQSGSKIMIRDNKGYNAVLLEINEKRIFDFCFFDETSGVFGVYDKKDFLTETVFFKFYLFCYSYEEKSFKYEYCFSTNIPCGILEMVSSKNLFPWCFQPVRLDGVLYGIECIDKKVFLREMPEKKRG